MRTPPLAALLIALFTPLSAAATPRPTPFPWSHVRPLNETSRQLATASLAQSSVVRDLVARLERTDVVLYLTDDIANAPTKRRAETKFISAAGGQRYLAVRVDQLAGSPRDRIALFAHELQHVLEVAQDRNVVDTESFAGLFRRIGREGSAGAFETRGAQATESDVRHELSGQAFAIVSHLPAEPRSPRS